MAQLVEAFQEKFKKPSSSFGLGMVRLISGTILGLAFALIGDEAIKYGIFSFLFVMVSIAAAFLKLSRSWRLSSVLVFDLICVLLGMLLRLYILVAPGQ